MATVTRGKQTDNLEAIDTALRSFKSGSELYDSSIALLAALGYQSNKKLRLDSPDFAGLIRQFTISADTVRPDKAMSLEWGRAEFLMQIGTDEITNTHSLFAADIDDKSYGSFLFFAIDLTGKAYNRSQIVAITRELNRAFNNPAVILFSYAGKLTLSIIDRRLHKKNPGKDVLEKVTLIKDINPV